MTNCLFPFSSFTQIAQPVVVQAVSLDSYELDYFQELDKASTFAFIDEIRAAKKETFYLPLNSYFWFVVESIFVNILSLT